LILRRGIGSGLEDGKATLAVWFVPSKMITVTAPFFSTETGPTKGAVPNPNASYVNEP